MKQCRLLAPLIVLLLSMTACKSTPSHTHILWPAKPAKPMLEFIDVYASSEDFDKNILDTIRAEIFPEPGVSFKLPFGISGDTGDTVYITDQNGIKSLNLPMQEFRLIVDRKKIKQPSGIAVGSEGILYVTDVNKKRVVTLSPSGEILASFGSDKIFGKPSHIAINRKNGDIYVSDLAKHRIATFDKNGKFLFFIGKPGKEQGEFAFPQGIAVSADNQLYIADMLNSRIQIFSSEGKFIRSFGQQGTDYRDFESPRGLAFGPDGNLYIVDFKKALLLTYSPDGTMLLATGNLKKSNHPLGFSAPASIFINGKGTIFITDMTNHRISVWQILTKDYLEKHPVY